MSLMVCPFCQLPGCHPGCIAKGASLTMNQPKTDKGGLYMPLTWCDQCKFLRKWLMYCIEYIIGHHDEDEDGSWFRGHEELRVWYVEQTANLKKEKELIRKQAYNKLTQEERDAWGMKEP